MNTRSVAKVMLLATLAGCTAADALEPMNAARRAQGMNARIVEVKSSHVVLLSQPQAVARFVREPAGGL